MRRRGLALLLISHDLEVLQGICQQVNVMFGGLVVGVLENLLGAYVMGLAFGFGWTPCVGPALAAILMIASGMGDITRGAMLLFVYGMAMTLPFVIAALFARPFLNWVSRHRNKLQYVEKIMGAMLVLFAILIATNSVAYIAQWMIEYMPWMASIG